MQTIQRVVVIGDIERDTLEYIDQSAATRSFTASGVGGTFFVAKVVRAALTNLDPGPKVISYDDDYHTPEEVEKLHLLQATWNIKSLPYDPEHDASHQAGIPGNVLRCKESPRSTVPITKVEAEDPVVPDPKRWLQDCTPDQTLLVIEDLNFEPRLSGTYPLTKATLDRILAIRNGYFEQCIKKVGQHCVTGETDNNYCPRLIAMINRHLPDFNTGLWNFLRKDYRERTLVVLYADILRWDGFPITDSCAQK